METTQTGMPIIDCGTCGGRHPEQRRHCAGCGAASAFISPAGRCLRCADIPAERRAHLAAKLEAGQCTAPYCVGDLEHDGGHTVSGQASAGERYVSEHGFFGSAI